MGQVEESAVPVKARVLMGVEALPVTFKMVSLGDLVASPTKHAGCLESCKGLRAKLWLTGSAFNTHPNDVPQ